MSWVVYIIEASDGRLYTGMTNDIERRWREHCGTKSGAKFFRGRSPRRIAYTEAAADRGAALRREAFIKRLNRRDKLALINEVNAT